MFPGISELIGVLIPLMLFVPHSLVIGSQDDSALVDSVQNRQPQHPERFTGDQNTTFVTDLSIFNYTINENIEEKMIAANSNIGSRQSGKNLGQVVFPLLQEGNQTKLEDSSEDNDDTNRLTDEMKEALANKSNVTNVSQIITYSDGGKIKIKDLKVSEAEAKNRNEITAQNTQGERIPCDKLLSVQVKSWHLLGNGSLLSLDDNVVYPPGYFWKTPSGEAYRGCYCSLWSCIRKCCPKGKTLSWDLTECEASSYEFLYPFKPNYTDETQQHPRFLYGSPCKEAIYMLDPENDSEDEFFLYSNGSLYIPHERTYLDSTEFCLEASVVQRGIFPVLCIQHTGIIPQPERGIHYAVGMLICIPFLAATFVAYALLPELRTLHGKCLMCHIGCNLVGYICLVVIQLWQNDFSGTTCTIFAMVAFFVNLTSFTWLSALCFDIWWTFSNFLPSRDGKKQERKKFILYSGYAWGIPILILIICIVMDFTPNMPQHYIKPEFGKLKCWLSTSEAWLTYYFGPIAILMVCNIILFIVTAVRIQKIKKETAVLKHDENQRHQKDNKEQSRLYFNLFVVMGISRMAVMIAWAILITMNLSVTYMWIIVHLLEVGMCIIFIGKRQFWIRLMKAMPCWKFLSTNKEAVQQESGGSNSTTVTVESQEGSIEMRKFSSSQIKSERS